MKKFEPSAGTCMDSGDDSSTCRDERQDHKAQDTDKINTEEKGMFENMLEEKVLRRTDFLEMQWQEAQGHKWRRLQLQTSC